MRIVRGRGYSAAEVATGAPVVVISESVARDLWGGAGALGAMIDRPAERISGPPPGWMDRLRGDLAGARVVGIVADATTDLARGELSTRMIYLPMPPEDSARASMVVRVSGEASAVAATLYQALRGVDPDVRPSVVTMRENFERETRDARVLAMIAGVTSLNAFVLAVTGVFGLAAFIIERRAAEIGLRVAVGASAAAIVRLMVRDSLRPVLFGATVGVIAATFFGRFMQTLLYGISAADPLALTGAVAILVGAATVAAIIPTRRIARIDPVAALRRR